jgi:hypothetical protein
VVGNAKALNAGHAPALCAAMNTQKRNLRFLVMATNAVAESVGSIIKEKCDVKLRY